MIISEGKKDHEFLCRLLKDHNIEGFDFAYPSPDPNTNIGGQGKDGLSDLMGGLLTKAPEIFKVKALIIILDSADNPQNALKLVQNAARSASDAKSQFGIPNALLERAISNNAPDVIALTLPWIDEPGGLETLILKAIRDKFKDAWDCVENYFACCKLGELNAEKQSKIKLACLIAAVCPKDPTCSVSNMWSEKKEVFRPYLTDPAFNQLVDFFKNLIKELPPPANLD